MQKSFWWWQCSDRYIISLSPHLHNPFSPSLISRTVSVDVKHHVYLLATPAGMDLYIQAMLVGTYRVQSPGFPKIVCWQSMAMQLFNQFRLFHIVCVAWLIKQWTLVKEWTPNLKIRTSKWALFLYKAGSFLLRIDVWKSQNAAVLCLERLCQIRHEQRPKYVTSRTLCSSSVKIETAWLHPEEIKFESTKILHLIVLLIYDCSINIYFLLLVCFQASMYPGFVSTLTRN